MTNGGWCAWWYCMFCYFMGFCFNVLSSSCSSLRCVLLLLLFCLLWPWWWHWHRAWWRMSHICNSFGFPHQHCESFKLLFKTVLSVFFPCDNIQWKSLLKTAGGCRWSLNKWCEGIDWYSVNFFCCSAPSTAHPSQWTKRNTMKLSLLNTPLFWLHTSDIVKI